MFHPFRDINEPRFSKRWWLYYGLRIALSLAIMIGMTLLVYFLSIPNPNMILISGLVVLTALYGYAVGVLCGLEMIAYSMFFFSTDHSFFSYTEINGQKLIVIIIGVCLCVAFVGRLKQVQSRHHRQLMQANELLRADNLNLEEASLTDALTGVRNRYAFRKDAGDHVGTSIYLAVLDVDDFKTINDENGHFYGDQVLKQIGSALCDSFGIENSYRLGGDEFLVICDEGKEAFFAHMEKAKAQINAIIKGKKKTLFSAGYVYGEVKTQEDLSFMITQADALLYASKTRGKDKVLGEPYDQTKGIALREKHNLSKKPE